MWEHLYEVSFPMAQEQSGLAQDSNHQTFGLLDGLFINLLSDWLEGVSVSLSRFPDAQPYKSF